MSEVNIDHTTIENLRELLGEGFGLLLDTYLSDGNERIRLIEEALNKQDLAVVCDQAHGLKGSNRNLGINALAELCGDIEDQTRKGNATDLEQKISALKQEFAATSVEIEKLR